MSASPLRLKCRYGSLQRAAVAVHCRPLYAPEAEAGLGLYTRLEMQWPGMCEAVHAIDAAAWDGALSGAAGDEVTVEVTARVTVEGTTNEKPPTTLELVGGKLEREEVFEVCLSVNAN